MHRPRLRLAVSIALFAVTAASLPGRGIAAGFPERDITFIIPNQVGGGFDAYVRAIAPAMEKYLPNKVNIVPLNIPAGRGRDPYGLAVPWNSPIKSIADLQKLSATRPVKFTTTGPDGTAYGVTMIATELLGIKLQLITGYK